MHPNLELLRNTTRRHFLKGCGLGLGSIALASLFERDAVGNVREVANPMAPRAPHFAPKAKRFIYLHMSGAPPHLDLFDYKPELVKYDGQLCPEEFTKGRRFAFTTGTPRLLGTPRKFSQHGSGGVWMSDAIPNFHGIVDEMCVLKSVHTEQFNHAP